MMGSPPPLLGRPEARDGWADVHHRLVRRRNIALDHIRRVFRDPRLAVRQDIKSIVANKNMAL